MRLDDAGARATAQMRCGLALMSGPRGPASVEAALEHFTAALAIRLGPSPEGSCSGYALAASWMNRAEALLQLGGTANLESAVDSLDAAVVALEALPLGNDPLAARRLAIALQNRALARGRLGRDTWTMVPDLFRALDLLAPLAGEDDERVGATMWLNIGVAQLLEPTEDAWRRAMVSARQALSASTPQETSDMRLAEIGLHARHLICKAAARCLEATGGRAVTSDVHAATDAVDEALVLVATWEARGVKAFRSLAAELFRFGRSAYEIYQPHFVDEFDRDHAACSTWDDPVGSATGAPATVRASGVRVRAS